jgi:hypothetical protein
MSINTTNTTIFSDLPKSTVYSICDLSMNTTDIKYELSVPYVLPLNYKQQIFDIINIINIAKTKTILPNKKCSEHILLLLSGCSNALTTNLNLVNNQTTRNVANWWDDPKNRIEPWLFLTDMMVKIYYLLVAISKTYNPDYNNNDDSINEKTLNAYLDEVNSTLLTNKVFMTRGFSLLKIGNNGSIPGINYKCITLIKKLNDLFTEKIIPPTIMDASGSCSVVPSGLTAEQIAANLKAAQDASAANKAAQDAAAALAASEFKAACSPLVSGATAAEQQLSATALSKAKISADIDLKLALDTQSIKDEEKKRTELRNLSISDQIRQDNAVLQMQIDTTAFDASNNSAYISTITKFSHFLELSQKYNNIALQNTTVDTQIKQDRAVYSTDNQLINFKSGQIEYLKRINYILFCGFYLLIIGVILVMFFYPNKLPNFYSNVFMIAVLCLYPFFINMIERYVLNTFLYLYSFLNGSVYVPSGIPEPPPPPQQMPATQSDPPQYIQGNPDGPPTKILPPTKIVPSKYIQGNPDGPSTKIVPSKYTMIFINYYDKHKNVELLNEYINCIMYIASNVSFYNINVYRQISGDNIVPKYNVNHAYNFKTFIIAATYVEKQEKTLNPQVLSAIKYNPYSSMFSNMFTDNIDNFNKYFDKISTIATNYTTNYNSIKKNDLDLLVNIDKLYS